MWDIVGIDSPGVDYVMNFDQFPRPDTKEELLSYSKQSGGKVATALATASRLGCSCGLLGTVGDDESGDFCRQELQQYSVDCNGLLVRKQRKTRYAVVLSDRQEAGRFIGFGKGTAEPLGTHELSENHLKHCKLLFLARQDEVAWEAAKIAKGSGAIVMLDPDYRSPLPTEFLSVVDLLVGSEFAYKQFYPGLSVEEACNNVLAQGPSVAVFTLGKRGCAGMDCKSEYLEIPAFPIKAVNTLGAGDVFHGAFCSAFLRKKYFREILVFASATAALYCTCVGGKESLPDLSQVEVFLGEAKVPHCK